MNRTFLTLNVRKAKNVMENIDFTWIIPGIITIILLIIFWRRRNAIWSGFAVGIIIGTVVAFIYLFRGDGFNWLIIGKGAILGTIAGFAAELLGMASDFIKRKE